MHIDSLLEHALEFNAEGERNLRQDKSLEKTADRREHQHVCDSLHVLLQHGVHHVGVRDQVGLVGSAWLAV